MMDQTKEQRVCIKFCANLGKSATQAPAMIQQAFGDQSLSRAQVFQWHALFKTGHTSVDGDTQRDAEAAQLLKLLHEFKELIRQDQHWTIHEIVEVVGICYGTYQWVLTEEFGMHCVTAKFVPRTDS